MLIWFILIDQLLCRIASSLERQHTATDGSTYSRTNGWFSFKYFFTPEYQYIQRGDAASVPETVPSSPSLEEILFLSKHFWRILLFLGLFSTHWNTRLVLSALLRLWSFIATPNQQIFQRGLQYRFADDRIRPYPWGLKTFLHNFFRISVIILVAFLVVAFGFAKDLVEKLYCCKWKLYVWSQLKSDDTLDLCFVWRSFTQKISSKLKFRAAFFADGHSHKGQVWAELLASSGCIIDVENATNCMLQFVNMFWKRLLDNYSRSVWTKIWAN